MTLSTQTPVTDQVPPRPLGSQAAAKETAPGATREHSSRSSRSTSADKLSYTLLIAGSIIMIIPFLFLVSASLKTESEVSSGSLKLIPRLVQWANYKNALGPDKMNFVPAFANTIVITTLCVIGQVFSCSLVGFGFARFKFRGRGLLFMIMLSTMMLPAQVTMIPVFVLFRAMGWIDTLLPLIIPSWFASPFFVFMFRQFFAQIPEELMEAARIDGANNWTIYWKLTLPLCGPVIAIVAIYTFLATWNDFLGPLIYLNSPEHRTLALALNAFNGQYGVSDAHLLMAASVVTMLPCIILFFAMQKYFVESVAMTGLKS